MATTQDPTADRARPAAAWLAWALCLLTVALVGLALLFLLLPDVPDVLPGPIASSLWTAIPVPFSLVGVLIAVRRPSNRIGRLLLGGALALSGANLAGTYASLGLRRGGLPGVTLAALLAQWLGVLALVALMLLLLLFPNGRLTSRGWRLVAWAVAAWGALAVVATALNPQLSVDPPLANPIGLPGAAGELLERAVPSSQAALSWILLLLACLGSLVTRFRRARGAERQQLKWFVYATSMAAVTTLFLPIGWYTFGILPWLSVWGVAVAIGVAILRHRLYDIDRVINRTLVYGALTVILGLGYAGSVLVLGQLLGQNRSNLAVAGTTLAVAALFRPVRGRVQVAVDRRFNRRRYDAAKTVEAFSARLRDEIDLDTLTAELLAVVDQTMQPTRASSLWLRPQAVTMPERPPGTTVPSGE